MYKCKIIYILRNGNQREWSEQWIEWDGIDNEDLDCIVEEYKAKEQKAIDNLDMKLRVIYAFVAETIDITDGKYLCHSCQCYCHKTDKNGDCYFCGGMSVTNTEK